MHEAFVPQEHHTILYLNPATVRLLSCMTYWDELIAQPWKDLDDF